MLNVPYAICDSNGSAYTNITLPFYYSSRAALFSFVSDRVLSMVISSVVYWTAALFYHMLDCSGWMWLDSYRIQDSDEMKNKNLVGRSTVIHNILGQQVVQILLALWWMDDEVILDEERHLAAMKHVESAVHDLFNKMLEGRTGVVLSVRCSEQLGYWFYWWGIPVIQFTFALLFMDTWQYFWHRLLHINPFLYRHVHSVHHRVYAPFAFASQYNHPVDGFILDTLGTALAQWVTLLTLRQSCMLFAFATLKNVRDHSGYQFPWDPFQLLFGCTADFHDIHHQRAGLKYNFSTPFFNHWDVWLGTRLTREQFNELRAERKYKGKVKAE